ncbi:Transposon TX1 uncharacterized protein [Nymphaea thermarum]|nr:Transposon TX1 uncharacterized protein [Nymphaea thermarum]
MDQVNLLLFGPIVIGFRKKWKAFVDKQRQADLHKGKKIERQRSYLTDDLNKSPRKVASSPPLFSFSLVLTPVGTSEVVVKVPSDVAPVHGFQGQGYLGDDILSALSAHFRDFYSKPLRFRATLPDFYLSSLFVSCAIALERPFQHQEIKNAVWAFGSGKAPGVDGFPVEFFRTFWEVCSADVFAFCDEFAYSSVFLKEFNQATCVLVPKRPNPTDVTHFRPISILGTRYKIIAKLLSLRLASVMPSVINPL